MGGQPPTGRGAGSDFLQLDPTSVPPRGLTTWLVDSLRRAVTDGRLARGSSLPASRLLASDLGVSRGVVVEAYRRLADEALVVSRVGAGTVVTASGTRGDDRAEASGPAAGPSAPTVPALDLSPGLPDLSAFPRAAWLRAERTVLTAASSADLGYGDPQGNARLRHELAGWLVRTRGLQASPDDILVVGGVAQALALLAQTLVAHGTHEVAVEDPGSQGARDELAHWGLRPVPVAVDEDGLRVGDLAATGVTAAVLTPAHQFPTGVVLAPDRRRALLDWARDGALVIEDDYDAEHRYDRAPVPALQASAPEHVAHTGSTSKTLAPGMRLGWLVPPRQLRAELVAAKHAADLGSPVIAQLVLAELLATGEYDRHLRRVRARQRVRRDALVSALREHLPDARIGGVAAGLHVLVSLPHLDGLTSDTDLADGIRSAGVLVHPLSRHRVVPGPPGLVVGYAAHPPDRLREAARRLGEVVAATGGRPPHTAR